jgi:hypothetical protein
VRQENGMVRRRESGVGCGLEAAWMSPPIDGGSVPADPVRGP